MQRYALTRASTVGPVADLVERDGGSLRRVFAAAELPRALLDQPDRLVLLRDQFRLVEAASREIGDDLLPARLSTAAGMDALGPYAAHLRTFGTLGAAIGKGYARYAALLQAATEMTLRVQDGMAHWSYAITAPLAIGRQKNEMLALGYMLAILRHFTGPRFAPDRITLPGRLPKRSTLAALFSADVVTGDRACMIFPAGWLDCPNPHPRKPAPSGPPLPEPDDFSALVAHLMTLELGSSGIRIDRVARRLGLSRRTLQRRLSECGTGFGKLSQEVLRVQACRHLMRDERSITEIAFDLGYADPAHFTRAFNRWTGESPQSWRRRQ